jgi:hypothetical protein
VEHELGALLVDDLALVVGYVIEGEQLLGCQAVAFDLRCAFSICFVSMPLR